MGQAREVTATYLHHYNHERPNQAITRGNRPPRVACPTFPARPPLPDFINPDGWLQAIHGERYARKVRHDGRVKVDERDDQVTRTLAGRQVVLEVDGSADERVVWHQQEHIKRLPIKGLQKTVLAWREYLAQMREAGAVAVETLPGCSSLRECSACSSWAPHVHQSSSGYEGWKPEFMRRLSRTTVPHRSQYRR